MIRELSMRQFLYVVLLIFVTGVNAATEKELELQERVDLLEKRLAKLEAILLRQAEGAAPVKASDEIVLMEGDVAEENVQSKELDLRLKNVEKFVEKESQDNRFKVYWKDGLKFKSRDERIKFNIGGRFYYDWTSGDIPNGDYEDGTYFRQARIHMKGSYDDFFYKAQYDFADEDGIEFKDAYVGLDLKDGVEFQAGQFKEPFGLDELTSSRYGSFMESSPHGTLVPGRNSGFMLAQYRDSHSFQAGVFHVSNDVGEGLSDDDEEGDWALTGRFTLV